MAYGSNQGFTDWLAANGYSLPAGVPSAAVLRRRIDNPYGYRFLGTPTSGLEQEHAWPRIGATIYGSTIASNRVPTRVIEPAS